MTNKWNMAGTDNSGEYVVVAIGERGRIGYRDLHDGSFRVRIEPSTPYDSPSTQAMAEFLHDWNKPEEGNNRISYLTKKGYQGLIKHLKQALGAVGTILEMNGGLPDDIEELVEEVSNEVHDQKVKEKELKLSALAAGIDSIVNIATNLAAELKALHA